MSKQPAIVVPKKPTGALAKRAAILNDPNIRHGFFTRRGGVSQGVYHSLNVGFGSQDRENNVVQNREIVAEHLQPGHRKIITPYQHHSSTVISISSLAGLSGKLKGDALVTNIPGLVIGVLTADCAPILFVDSHAKIIGAAHAGWRGALDGILENSIQAMCALGGNPSHISCAIGPCISQENYEVGLDFKDQFLNVDSNYAQFFMTNSQTGNFHFNLKAFVKHKLQLTGISTVETLPDCTYGSESDFFSYRRNTHESVTDYGRQMSAICLRS